VLLTPFPGTVDFDKWASDEGRSETKIDGVPITRYWLIPEHKRPKLFTPHRRSRWKRFVSGRRAPGTGSTAGGTCGSVRGPSNPYGTDRLRARVEDVSSDVREHGHCHRQRAHRAIRPVGRWLGLAARRLFVAPPMPDLAMPRAPEVDNVTWA